MAGGSSPLARGLLNLAVVDIPFEGIIPARAGFTPAQSLWRPAEADHPRSRGVYFLSASWNLMSAGSSPLARGLLVHEITATASPGIIPARAGFTRSLTRPRSAVSDHPRSRGVYLTALASWIGWLGSSPLARGLLGRRCLLGLSHRIIPARAGFTVAGAVSSS